MVQQFPETGFHKPHSVLIDPKNAAWITPDDLHDQLPVSRAVVRIDEDDLLPRPEFTSCHRKMAQRDPGPSSAARTRKCPLPSPHFRLCAYRVFCGAIRSSIPLRSEIKPDSYSIVVTAPVAPGAKIVAAISRSGEDALPECVF